jgi:hypothetical protein
MNIDINELNLQPSVDDVDVFLLKFCFEHKYPSLMASAIILARLLHLNKQAGNAEDFAKLLATVSVGIHNKDYEVPENLH